MRRTIVAIYEDGVLRPLELLEGIAERSRVKLTLHSVEVLQYSLADCVGILPDEDAEEMRRIIETEFEQVNPGDWQPNRIGHQ